MRKSKLFKKTTIKILVTILLIIIAILCYFHFYVNPQIFNANVSYMKASAIKAVNNGLVETLSLSDYEDLVSIEKDSNGKVNLIKINSANANKLNSDILKATQTALEHSDDMQIDIPIGTFTGLPILNGVGSTIPVKLVPIGSVETKFVSRFDSVAINQSCHKIMLKLSANISLLLPLGAKEVNVTTQILVAECVIVGEVPSVYLNTDNLTNALNLIPQ